MKNLDINNPEHAKSIQEILKQGAQSEFWKIICQRLQESIDSIQRQLDSPEGELLVAEEYKIRNEVLKKQKIDRNDILTMPEDLLRELDSPEFFVQEEQKDVYATREDFK